MDPSAGELLKQGKRVKIQDQPFRLLIILLENAGEVVARAEIQARIWEANTFVDFDSSLRVAVGKLREALEDDAGNPHYVETVSKRGYRFLGPVATTARAADPAPIPEASPLAARPEDDGRPMRAVRRWTLALAICLLAIAGAGTWLMVSRSHKVLGKKDTLVLADFDNKTGDAVFDGTLRQGLSVELEQTPFLQLVSDSQIGQTLRLMEKPPETRLTQGVARDVCRRANATVDIEGSIAALGNQYVIGLIAVDCRTGETLAREQVSASGKERVLNALGSAASELRGKLGETRISLEKFDTPLEQATTPSLEALQAYTFGRRAMDGFDVVQAPSFFQQAIRLDPNFAIAYARLGTSYINLGELGLGTGYIRQAYQMHERLSEPEKLYIDSHYYQFVTGDMEKANQVYELWAQTYPQDWTPRINLGADYETLGQYDRTLEEYRETLRLQQNAMVYWNLANTYLHLNRLEEARSVVQQALANEFDSPDLHVVQYRLAFLQRDPTGMAKESRWAAGQPGGEDMLLASQADTAAYYGRLGEARNLSRLAAASAERAEQHELAAAYEADAALREALFGNAAETRKLSAGALSLSENRYVLFETALALAFLGDGVRAQHLADDLDKRFPEDTVAHCNYLPSIRAVLALNNKEPSKAIEILGPAAPCELGLADIELPSAALYPAYVRGEAYLAAHQGKEAAVEFQKILDHTGVVLDEPIATLAHVGLARACEMAEKPAEARAQYQDFFALWKDADPDIPILKQAKSEYAKLQ